MSAVAFCRARGISTVSLGLWRKRYGLTHRVANDGSVLSPPPWVPVVLRQATPALPQTELPERPARYALVAASGRLEVPHHFDAREVGALWRILTAATTPNSGVEVAL